ncbi:sodium pump decarboxylase subunit gamma [Billgrantia tianxiuensis]|jgi:oxaloacetate decarboxylase gamma subunit|uniref:Probable oxaloacetate decarboxylase gamma chain n=1 Tax=Billgrantia tianxiuensis TaxID=2497861 RepID=A0A6I6SJJ2_9GAMM|nr:MULTISPECIES: OadG family transporter subunit [Halomonas]MCE8033057.1 sodium pump decarboxylase subunit gamma [Halomonas sp. MCCC 1A11057]QHC48836.1 sodium pump decarboxylase subunit gamma [Halomonas tianxiuensis]
MRDEQLLLDGLALMGVGMGFVFVFLTLLVLVTTLMSWVVCRLAPATPPAPAPVSKPSGRADDAELMAAITAAIHRYRRRHRR